MANWANRGTALQRKLLAAHIKHESVSLHTRHKSSFPRRLKIRTTIWKCQILHKYGHNLEGCLQIHDHEWSNKVCMISQSPLTFLFTVLALSSTSLIKFKCAVRGMRPKSSQDALQRNNDSFVIFIMSHNSHIVNICLRCHLSTFKWAFRGHCHAKTCLFERNEKWSKHSIAKLVETFSWINHENLWPCQDGKNPYIFKIILFLNSILLFQ